MGSNTYDVEVRDCLPSVGHGDTDDGCYQVKDEALLLAEAALEGVKGELAFMSGVTCICTKSFCDPNSCNGVNIFGLW